MIWRLVIHGVFILMQVIVIAFSNLQTVLGQDKNFKLQAIIVLECHDALHNDLVKRVCIDPVSEHLFISLEDWAGGTF